METAAQARTPCSTLCFAQGDRHTQQLVECQRALVRAFEGHVKRIGALGEWNCGTVSLASSLFAESPVVLGCRTGRQSTAVAGGARLGSKGLSLLLLGLSMR